MSELRRQGGDGGGGRSGCCNGDAFDAGNVHLKKELTQIRKAARVLKDPGTTSSWRSPLASSRSAAFSATANRFYLRRHHHHTKSVDANDCGIDGIDEIDGGGNSQSYGVGKLSLLENKISNANGKDKKVVLCNWRTPRSESEASAATRQSHRRRELLGRDGVNDDCNGNEGSSSVADDSVEDSFSDARNGGNDSKSDSYLTERYASMIFKYNGFGLGPPIRRTTKTKAKKNAHSAGIFRNHGLQKQMVIKSSKGDAVGLPHPGLHRDDPANLVDQSDDTDNYCNSEDLNRISTVSPLLARLKKKNWSHSSRKFHRTSRKEDSSYSYSTPALSTSSYNRYGVRNPSTVGSWDATTASYNDGADEVDLDLLGQQGCGIPCCRSKRLKSKYRGRYDSYSPSLSDTLRRTGSSILCGSQSIYRRRRHSTSLSSNKGGLLSKATQGVVPLLTSNGDGRAGSSLGSANSDDEISTNFGELDLEALSRLDGRRWSLSCRSQEGLEIVPVTRDREGEGTPENIRSLSQKYRPMFFDEIIGQNIVVQSLINAISRGRIAPVYLFQGPRGTGKTSTARIFSAALNCLSADGTRPCGVCRECSDFISGNGTNLREVDGTNKKGIDRVRYLLRDLSSGPPSGFSRYKVFVIDDCHLLPSKTWLAFLKFLDEPPPRVVFIFITTDLDSIPRTVLSRCQKYLFNKIKDGDIVTRLRKIATDENLDFESDALDLVALNADGSLRDAETMLDQLSLLGKTITTSIVNELVGVVSDEKLLELLELAMSSDTAETVKRARELMDSGVDPMVLMSQLATIIMDVIAGTYQIDNGKHNDSFLGGRNLSEAELERLKHALKLLSEAEKQLRGSSERSTWFTATLLLLGSAHSTDITQSGSSRRQSFNTTDEGPSCNYAEAVCQKRRVDGAYAPRKSSSPMSFPTSYENPLSLTNGANLNSKANKSVLLNCNPSSVLQDDCMAGDVISRCGNSNLLDDIWTQSIERCHSRTLRQLLHTWGKLVSISEVEGVLVAYIAFGDKEVKARVERFLSSITNSFEIVLRRNVEVRIVVFPDGVTSISSRQRLESLEGLNGKKIISTDPHSRENKVICTSAATGGKHTCGSYQEPLKVPGGSFDSSQGKLSRIFESSVGPSKMSPTNERKSEIPVNRIESIIHEQKLETAWLQAVEKGTPGSMSRLKPERNQVLPQDGTYNNSQVESTNSIDRPSRHWGAELNREIKALNINNGKPIQRDQLGKRVENYPMSPSLLHDRNFVGDISKDNTGYESSSAAGGCGGLLCWNNSRHHRRKKVKQGTPVRSCKRGRLLWFADRRKPRTDNISRR